MPRPGRPFLSAAQNRMLGNAEKVLEICQADLGLTINDAVQTLHIALALARTEADAQRNINRGSNQIHHWERNPRASPTPAGSNRPVHGGLRAGNDG